MTTLRPYQTDVISAFHTAVARGQRRTIICAPTGAGKTLVGAAIINDLVHNNPNKSVLVLAHRREIITLTSTKLRAAGVAHGIIQAGTRGRPLEVVQVASIQTLWVRTMHTRTMDLPPADLLVVDECHHAPAETYRKIIAAYPNAVLLGLTATPCRGDGRGLGGITTDNNGKIYLPQRTAEKELGSKRDQIIRWFRELQHFGFIEMISPGHLGVDGHGRAPRWRLTELPYRGKPATRDFLLWSGALFGVPKTESRSRKRDHHGPENGAKRWSRKWDHRRSALGPENGAKGAVPKTGPNLDTSSHREERLGDE